MSTSSRQIECTIPILPVRDLTRSVAFYTQSLGFKLDWGGEEGSRICSVSRDGCAIMLSQRDTMAEPVWVWIGCEDESLFETWRSNGVKVSQKPRNCSWAYETKFEDLDGNVLWLGTEPRRDEPFEDQKPS
ncbi:MAG: VOC family protein [Prosthecobacter sp.]|jgi:predicted lactoylglutathione lyase|uniref:VOC family protein n=1 Tax=Prosthecobacter sp. TaxID=1965333 RepID=UPI0019FEA321|nr:VOC family protein [Prosthecobacter sp.]MBE2284811.1 VOC family protein [Prosthecobacter sp.]